MAIADLDQILNSYIDILGKPYHDQIMTAKVRDLHHSLGLLADNKYPAISRAWLGSMSKRGAALSGGNTKKMVEF